MADDLHRDLLPVRENSYVESFRGSIIDPRERLIVGKLNRRDLEDKYLRLFEDYQEIKKLYNSQEDKIKRLSTKLMRVCTTPRLMNYGTYNGNNERDRISSLILENSKLKEKVNILRNQILSHRVLARPSSHNKRLQVCHSSAVTSYRSDGPIKVGTCQNFIAENNEIQHYITRVKELEIQKKKMMNRITELENKIEINEAGNQKEKIAENVEYIRVWRQMKLQNEKCVETEAKNKALTEENETLRNLLDETSRNHGEITEKFRAEKELTSELKEQVSRTQSIEADLREKDEKIRILSNELKILQDHKNQMVELSKRDSSTELENGQLKQKLSDIMADNISLKTAFNTEQANIASLQSVNAQLREKLQDLQTSVDILTVKLNAFEKQTVRDYIPKSPARPKPAERTSHPVLICECTTDESEVHLIHSSPKVQKDNGKKKTKPQSPVKKAHNYSESSMQTEFRLIDWKNGNQKEDKACSTEECVDSPLRSSNRIYENTLTPEKMLKLLDDAQINSPLSSQNVSKIGLEDIGSTSYGNPIRRQRQVLALETLLFSDTDCF
ncbi:protein fantom-like [Chelonus insularis]|uniref:protein fantom-like n=1 Tax=Chelonus insularis TaxID=460826 RepID=UPI0015894AD2|nr:protein fantom-like [Chelonus insularis]XP_034942786.1 protein fantom-like [Chelonus insularis]XP_034942787.1 protein fantom-like [Chelonus insularis]